MSNMKQIGLAFQQYSQDYDETFSGRDEGNASFRLMLMPYIKSVQIWKCPSNPSTNKDWCDNTISTNYILNNANNQFPGGGPGCAIASINAPANKLLLVEFRNDSWSDFASNWWPNANCDAWNNGWAGHTSLWNNLFVDGHVKAQKPSNSAAPFNQWAYNNDNVDNFFVNGMNCVQKNFQ